MQPTVQSEQDKMVPIDTSGDPVEIEVKEDDKKEDEVQVEQEPQVETKEEKKRRRVRRIFSICKKAY